MHVMSNKLGFPGLATRRTVATEVKWLPQVSHSLEDVPQINARYVGFFLQEIQNSTVRQQLAPQQMKPRAHAYHKHVLSNLRAHLMRIYWSVSHPIMQRERILSQRMQRETRIATSPFQLHIISTAETKSRIFFASGLI